MYRDEEIGEKLIVCFIVGLLIGGLLVWALSGDTNNLEQREKQLRHQEAIDACINQGGVPIIGNYDTMIHCAFKEEQHG